MQSEVSCFHVCTRLETATTNTIYHTSPETRERVLTLNQVTMASQGQRTCVFKRCPDTDYVPRNSICTPTSIYALDLADWTGMARVMMLEHAILKALSYLESDVDSISYHLIGEDCGMQRPLMMLFDDPIQHSPQRRSKGVLLHLQLQGKKTSINDHHGGGDAGSNTQKVVIKLAFHEGEHFDARQNSWKSVTPYAWDSGSSVSQILIDTNILVADLPELFRKEILNCASRDQSFTTHYLRDYQSNVLFTSAVTIDGVLVSLDDRTPSGEMVSELVGSNDQVIHAAVVMTKIKISAPTPGMTLHDVRPVLLKPEALPSKVGTLYDYRRNEIPR